MAIRLITGRFQQWSNACKKQFYEKRLHAVLLLLLLLEGPALFRGRIRAFGKCTDGVAFLKGRPNLASVRLTL